MPRVSINRKKYIVQTFYEWLEGKRAAKSLKQSDIGKMLGVNQQSVSRKMLGCKNGKPSFSQEELLIIFNELEATDEDILRLMKL